MNVAMYFTLAPFLIYLCAPFCAQLNWSCDMDYFFHVTYALSLYAIYALLYT